MKLFFIAHNEPDASLDWFVVANDPAEAVAVWRKIDMVADLGVTEPERVFQVPCIPPVDVDEPLALAWHLDIEDVTP